MNCWIWLRYVFVLMKPVNNNNKNVGLGKVKSQNSVIKKNNIHNIYLFWVEDNISIYFLGTGMDRVFLGLAMLLQEVFQWQIPRKIPRSSPASPRKIPSIQTLLIGFTVYLKQDILVIFLIFPILMFEKEYWFLSYWNMSIVSWEYLQCCFVIDIYV